MLGVFNIRGVGGMILGEGISHKALAVPQGPAQLKSRQRHLS